MATQTAQLLEDLLLALRASHAHVDLSTAGGTPRVIVDEGAEPPVGPPWVALGLPDDIECEPGEVGLTSWWVSGSFKWVGYVAGTADTPYNRALRAMELASDVITALNNAWRSNGVGGYTIIHKLPRFQVTAGPFVGDSSDDLLSEGIAFGSIRFTIDSETGGI